MTEAPRLDDATFQYSWYPDELVPLLSHSEVKDEGVRVHDALAAHQLLAYIRFTIALESGPVQRVMERLCDPSYLPERSYWLKTEANAIADEERQHAHVHEHALCRFEQETGMQAPSGVPAFVRRLGAITGNLSASEVAFVEFLFVCISETLITSDLRALSRAPQVHPEVRSLARNHADDESRHSAYFHRLFADTWPRLDTQHQHHATSLIPRLLRAYLSPDRDWMFDGISRVWGATDRAESIVNAVCDGACVRERMLRAARPTLRMLATTSVPLEIW